MYFGGIDIGGTSTKVGLVSLAGELIASAEFPTACTRNPHDLVSRALSMLRSGAAAHHLAWPPVAMGIGVPGVVDANHGIVRFSGALGWEQVPLRDIATAVAGCPVAIDNDVNAGALADTCFGEARNVAEMIYISWGTGIGAALVIGGQPYHSRGSAMGNLGHAPADPASSRRCYCGVSGCLEIEAGGKAIVDRYREHVGASGSRVITPRDITLAAQTGDRIAAAILDRSATLLARVVAGAVALLNPEMIVMAGGVSGCLDFVEPVFRAELENRVPAFSRSELTIVRSKFKAEAGVVGAAVLAERGEYANKAHV